MLHVLHSTRRKEKAWFLSDNLSRKIHLIGVIIFLDFTASLMELELLEYVSKCPESFFTSLYTSFLWPFPSVIKELHIFR